MSDIITLDSIKAEHRRLAGIIAQYETQPVKWDKPVLIMPPKLDKGERWAGALITPSRREHIIAMPDDFDPADWNTQMDRIKAVGGEAPDRLESALAYAEIRDAFQKAAYWTREPHASAPAYAWLQYFDDGNQYNWTTLNELRARAFRRLPI
jgi:hypothetical protein